MLFLLLGLLGLLLLHEAPVEEGVVDEGLEDGHEAVLVVPEDAHDGLAGAPVRALDAGDLHGVDEHPREAEGDLFGELVPSHGDLEAVSEVNVEYLAAHAVEQQVGGVPARCIEPSQETLSQVVNIRLNSHLRICL